METLFIYGIKSSGLITMFYLAYYFLLRKETFFTGNRWFLLAGLFTSTLLPLLFYTKIVWVEPSPTHFDWSKIPVSAPHEKQTFEIDWYLVLGIAYGIGILLFLLKFALDFYSLKKVLKGKPIQRQADFKFMDVTENVAPFSYFNTIVYNSSLYSPTELENILEHEKVHSEQNHTLDVLISRFFCIVFWFNPLIWLYQKAILQNLEFIADSEATKKISDTKAYQFTLLKITTHENCVAITNHFYQSLIKKRIVMLNKNQSRKWNSWKYALILPVLVAFVLLFQMEVIAMEKTNLNLKNKNTNEIIDIVITKNTTNEEIKEQCEKLNKSHNINLSFFNIKRNSNGEIINIDGKFNNTEGSGTCNQSENPIKPFKFFYNVTKKEIGFNMDMSISKSTYKEKIIKADTLRLATHSQIFTADTIHLIKNVITKTNSVNNYNKPIIIINGKKTDPKININDINPNIIQNVSVFKGALATGKYGEEGKNGVIEIITTEKIGENEFESLLGKNIIAQEIKNNVIYTPENIVLNKKAIIIINGKKADSQINIDDINTDVVENISVFKGKVAIEKYGEDGKNGVILITTNDEAKIIKKK